MSSSHRTALSLLLTVLLFSGICVAAFFGGFRYVEMHYYEPRVVENITKTLDAIGSEYDEYTDDIIFSFATYALSDNAKSFIERDVTETDIEERDDLTGRLMEKNPSLDGIRLIESDGKHIHYSTFSSDILSKSDELISYRNYDELGELPFEFICSSDNGLYPSNEQELAARTSIYCDSIRERIVISMPYFDRSTAYRGTLIFYTSTDDFLRRIISKNVVQLNTRSKLISKMDEEKNTQSPSNTGFAFGLPNVGRERLAEEIQKKWDQKLYGTEQLFLTESGEILILVSGTVSRYGKMGWICGESEFIFSDMEKILLLLCLFVTVFLIIFLLFNLRHDDSVIIRERIHKFETTLFREYLERRDREDWKTLEKHVEKRKQDVNTEIIRSLGRTGRKHKREISDALDTSWNEFLHIISGNYRQSLEALSNPEPASSNSLQPISVQPNPVSASSSSDIEELEEIPEAEELEEVSDLEEIPEAEEVDEVSELEDADEVEEIPELDEADEVEELEEVSDLEEIPEAEDADEVPELEEESGTEADLETISFADIEEKPPVKNDEKKGPSSLIRMLEEEDFGTPTFSELDDEENSSFWDENSSKVRLEKSDN